MLALSLPPEFWSSRCPQGTASDAHGLFLRGGYFPIAAPASHSSCGSPAAPQAPVSSTVRAAPTPAGLMSPEALVHSAEGSCWGFPHSPWHAGPSHPTSACPGSLCGILLHSTGTSCPINTRPGSGPPPQPLGGGGSQGWQAVSLETEPTAFLTEPL